MVYLMLKTPMKAKILEMYDCSSMSLAELSGGGKTRFFSLPNQARVYQWFWILLCFCEYRFDSSQTRQSENTLCLKIYLKNNQTRSLLKSISNL